MEADAMTGETGLGVVDAAEDAANDELAIELAVGDAVEEVDSTTEETSVEEVDCTEDDSVVEDAGATEEPGGAVVDCDAAVDSVEVVFNELT